MDKQNLETGVAPAVLSSKISDGGGDFIVIQRQRQGEEPKIWSTGDQEQTDQLFRQVARSYESETTT